MKTALFFVLSVVAIKGGESWLFFGNDKESSSDASSEDSQYEWKPVWSTYRSEFEVSSKFYRSDFEMSSSSSFVETNDYSYSETESSDDYSSSETESSGDYSGSGSEPDYSAPSDLESEFEYSEPNFSSNPTSDLESDFEFSETILSSYPYIPPSSPNCPSANGWVERDGECYYFSDLGLYYELALKVCHNHAATLYSPLDHKDLSWLVNEWRDRRDGQNMAWVGCSDRRDEGTWECDGSHFGFSDWGPGEPSNNPQQHCMMMLIDPYWAGYGQQYDNECNLFLLPFVCKAGCPNKPNWISHNGNCFYFSPTGLSYPDAVEYCHDRGLKVWSPDNTEEQEFFLNTFNDHFGTQYSMAYIGCNDIEINGYWKCDDGHGAVFNNFGAGDPSHEPGEACVVTFIDRGWAGYGKWWDNPCDFKLPFVCSYW